MKALLKAGADVNAADDGGATALTLAFDELHADAVHVLIAAGASVNRIKVDDEGVNLLMASNRETYGAVVELAIKADDVHARARLARIAQIYASIYIY